MDAILKKAILNMAVVFAVSSTLYYVFGRYWISAVILGIAMGLAFGLSTYFLDVS